MYLLAGGGGDHLAMRGRWVVQVGSAAAPPNVRRRAVATAAAATTTSAATAAPHSVDLMGARNRGHRIWY